MADTISFKCSNCGKEFNVSAKLAGRKAQCPCGTVVDIPKSAAASTGAPPEIDEAAATQVQPGAPQQADTAPPAGGPAPKWRYMRGDKQFGPAPQAELEALLAGGELPPDTYVWTKGLSGWQAASQVEALKFESPGAPAPAAEEGPAEISEEPQQPDTAPVPAQAPAAAPAAASVATEPSGAPRYPVLKVFSAAVRVCGGVACVVGLFHIVLGVVALIAAKELTPLATVRLYCGLGGLLIGVPVAAFGELMPLMIAARAELWRIRRALEQKDARS